MEQLPKLTPEDLGDDPLRAYVAWVDQARAAGVVDPDAVVAATATPDGVPSARAVLVRVVDDEGVLFFTNHDSQKGRELAANDRIALTAVWTAVHRQVRIAGRAERATDAESDAYWATRPHGSRLAAIASPQSRPIGRDALQARWEELARQYPEGTEIPRPDHWGGVRVRPERIEFWQGRPFRLHDRLVYQPGADGWDVERLAP